MPFNGSGVFQRVRNWVADATAGIKIRADFHDSEDDGFADGLSNCITRDGQSTITQNIPMNNHRITGLANPVNAQDAATKGSTETYANNRVLRSGDFMSGPLQANPSGPITSPTHAGSIVISGDSGNAAMSFVANGVFGANFGIAHDGNFYMGGWTHGVNAYKFWTTRDFAVVPGGGVMDGRWILIGDVPTTWSGALNEPANGGVVSGVYLTTSGSVSALRLRGLQLFVGYWYSIAYA